MVRPSFSLVGTQFSPTRPRMFRSDSNPDSRYHEWSRSALALVLAWALFSLAAGATLTIWVGEGSPDRIFECGACVLGIITIWNGAGSRGVGPGRDWVHSSLWLAGLIALLGLWGFGQIALGATVYRWATLNTSLRIMALAATAVTAWFVMGSPQLRDVFLQVLAWFGFLLGVVSVLAYFTSPRQVLWLFVVPYPDVWGPFLSRNNFAQFLELTFPAALALGLVAGSDPNPAGDKTNVAGAATYINTRYVGIAAGMLAAGLTAASRAGAVMLVLEAAAAFWLSWGDRPKVVSRRTLMGFLAAAAAFSVVVGTGRLWTRLKQPDPLEYRREILRSALAMIREHPGSGTGLGTFPVVYPAYAEFDSGAVVDHAHSDWLEWASEGGLPYAALWGLLALSLARPAFRSIWGMGVPAVLIHALVDYPFARFGIAAWVFILAGALMRTAGERTRCRPPLTERRWA
jgi:O-antigen ligase